MTTYLIKRLLAIIPTLLGITLITFFFIKLAPGNPVSLKMQGGEALKAGQITQESMDRMLRLYGLKVDLPPAYENFISQATIKIHGSDPKDKPFWTRKALFWLGQNAIQYKTWIVGLAHGDFGISFKDRRPVSVKIKEALPITLTLNLIELLIVYFISIPLGVFSAVRGESLLDKIIMLFLFLLYSLPDFWIAVLLIMYFAGGDHFSWFPLSGFQSEGAETYPFFMWLGNVAWHLVLPVTVMVYGSFAFLSRFARSSMLEVIKQDYIRTAKAKGLPMRTVVWRHGFRNSLIPLLTLMGTLLPSLIGGSVIIEQIFSIPGMGKLAFESALARDYPTVMAIATITCALTLISLLLGDLAYVWADPRITFEARGEK